MRGKRVMQTPVPRCSDAVPRRLPDAGDDGLLGAHAEEPSFGRSLENGRHLHMGQVFVGAAAAPPLAEEPFVGIWQDRPDMEDSSAWVRAIRAREWRGGGNGVDPG